MCFVAIASSRATRAGKTVTTKRWSNLEKKILNLFGQMKLHASDRLISIPFYACKYSLIQLKSRRHLRIKMSAIWHAASDADQ